MSLAKRHYKTCLSIAGSDPYGGAGVQADIKTFSALGCYAMGAITALTVQNSQGVRSSQPVDADLVEAQAQAVADDVRIDALKIGMTCNAEIIEVLARFIERTAIPFIVLDPIMVSSSGHRLLDEEAIATLKRRLLPLCTLATPNLDELAALASGATTDEQVQRLAAETSCPNILAKGGHADGLPIDVLFTPTNKYTYTSERIATPNTHGTGCTLSSAIAAFVARGLPLPEAVEQAKEFVTQALRSGADVEIGQGHGAMNHFFAPLPLEIDKD